PQLRRPPVDQAPPPRSPEAFRTLDRPQPSFFPLHLEHIDCALFPAARIGFPTRQSKGSFVAERNCARQAVRYALFRRCAAFNASARRPRAALFHVGIDGADQHCGHVWASTHPGRRDSPSDRLERDSSMTPLGGGPPERVEKLESAQRHKFPPRSASHTLTRTRNYGSFGRSTDRPTSNMKVATNTRAVSSTP